MIKSQYCLIVFVVNSFIFERVTSQCDIAQVCVTDLSVEDCLPGQVLVPHMTISNCCPGCQTPSSGGVIESGVCNEPSNCLPDGRYAPVQCKGDHFTGRCFCSDANGNRIFGQSWRSEAEDMTCACSRRRADLEQSGRTGVTLHCTRSGDYEPLQCDDGLCWCAEPKTGQPTVSPVLESDMKHLPCYSTSSVGDQYLRKCESLVQAVAYIHQEQSEHGTNFFGDPTTFCDYDGSYGPIQILNGIAYCTGSNGNILGSWQVVSSAMAGMNCNCALDTMVYFPERGMTVTETCQANGNYSPNQNVDDIYYCVDTDGYPIEFLNAWPADMCASHAARK